MNEFDDGVTVEVTLHHVAGRRGHRIPRLDVTLTSDGREVSGAKATAIREALPHTFVDESMVEFEVVESDTGLADVVGEATAENLADAGYDSLPAAKEASDADLSAVTGVGPATISDIREA